MSECPRCSEETVKKKCYVRTRYGFEEKEVIVCDGCGWADTKEELIREVKER